jgi:hypothetical protein
MAPFGFAQMEFGFLLGPGDGRFLVRGEPQADPQAVLVLSTLGVPERRRLRGRRGELVEEGAPEPVPTTRATVVRAEAFESAEDATGWLDELRRDSDRADSELEWGFGILNRALHAYRVARADPHVRDVAIDQTLVVRLGYGAGEEIVDGRYGEAWELPRAGVRTVKRSMEAPEERFAAVLGGRETALACEELVLRARMDLDGGRSREAALQARIALEALLAEIRDLPGDRRGPLEADRGPVSEAANAALHGPLSAELLAALDAGVRRMEAALRTRRLTTSS